MARVIRVEAELLLVRMIQLLQEQAVLFYEILQDEKIQYIY